MSQTVMRLADISTLQAAHMAGKHEPNCDEINKISALQAAQMTGKYEPNWAEISKISALQATHMTNISQTSKDFCPARSTNRR
jgi:hypothetical protein